MPKSNKVVGFRLGEEASHCLSVASFGLRAKAVAHGPAKIFTPIAIVGSTALIFSLVTFLLHQGKRK